MTETSRKILGRVDCNYKTSCSHEVLAATNSIMLRILSSKEA
jgi:hypothetical protein